MTNLLNFKTLYLCLASHQDSWGSGMLCTLSDNILADKTNENLTCCRKCCPPKILSAEIFCQLKFRIYPVPSNHIKNQCQIHAHKTDQTFSVEKTAEISNWCQKFCPPKNFVHRKLCSPKFCPIRYLPYFDFLNFWSLHQIYVREHSEILIWNLSTILTFRSGEVP